MAGVGREGEVGNALVMAMEFLESREVAGGGPDAKGFIGGGRAQEVAVGGEFDGGNRAFVGG